MPDKPQRGFRNMSSNNFFVIFLLSLVCFFQHGCATTVVVDGVSEWKNPVAQTGDTIIFRHKNHSKLYIFRNEEAFSTCNFTQATLLSNPNSTSYTWKPSRPGIFYFSFSNGANSACQKGQKWAVKVLSPLSKSNAPAAAPKSSPAPIPGGIISSSPGYEFPSLPPQAADSPAGIPGLVPQKGGGIAIIDSNPAVPLPTDAADSNGLTQPLHASRGDKQVVGRFLVAHMSLCVVACLMV
uniref:Uncharacterized protein n=1 Tax=Kalanchoe fedtschenkoi TaxID=63787 RepID=A0A7N0UB73_KALFE